MEELSHDLINKHPLRRSLITFRAWSWAGLDFPRLRLQHFANQGFVQKLGHPVWAWHLTAGSLPKRHVFEPRLIF